VQEQSADRQRYSLYHDAERGDALTAWMAPYADLFAGRRQVLDVGCGPGYFLALLQQRGVPGFGVDRDAGMVTACQAKGFVAEVADARDLPVWPGRFDGIHAGHIIEHMDGETAIRFLERCTAALQPGGLLVIRTPNWDNETVRNGGFWMDVSHVRPYPLPVLDRILRDLGHRIVRAGAEARGWQDLYLVSEKQG
jgi:SAM-dependent methyltransferase